MIAFLAKISIVFAASTLLFYLIAVVNRKLAKMIRNKAEESEHAWTEEESNPCHDGICFFCGKDIDGRSIFVQHMHRAIRAGMTTPMNLSTVYEDKVVSIPCCEGCLAANKAAVAKADRNAWIAALLALAAVFAAVMYLFHGHSGAWIVAAALALLAGIVVHSVAGWIAKPAYRKKIEEYPVVAELRGKTWEIGAAPGIRMSIEPAFFYDKNDRGSSGVREMNKTVSKVTIVGVEGSGKTVLMSALGNKYEQPDSGLLLSANSQQTYALGCRAGEVKRAEWRR